MNIYDTTTLMAVQRNIKPVSNYWLALLFPMVQTFDTEHIDFDKVEGGRRLAPFVAPTSQGKIMTEQGYTTNRFTPAYVKPKHVVNPNKQFKRLAGEDIGGTLSTAQRLNAAVGENMRMEKEMINRRLEVMASEAVLKGTATVSGDNYPTTVVDFGRDAGQTVTLAVGSKWGEAGVSIVDDVEDWVNQTQELSGFAPDRLTVTPSVWKIMSKDAEVKALLDTKMAGQTASLDLAVGNGMPVQYKGRLGAILEVWVYNELYENYQGVTVPVMEAGTIALTSSGVQGVRCFGAIQDAASMQAVEMFPKMWLQQDPSVVYTMTQSAPLMVPTNPNATFTATVL